LQLGVGNRTRPPSTETIGDLFSQPSSFPAAVVQAVAEDRVLSQAFIESGQNFFNAPG
jgi:hypothetical protein